MLQCKYMKAETIKEIRKRLRYTQKELAEDVGVDQVTVNRWENGARRPSKLAVRQLERLQRKAKIGDKEV